MLAAAGGSTATGTSQTLPGEKPKPLPFKEYSFLDIELKYGFLQVSTETNLTPQVFLYLYT